MSLINVSETSDSETPQDNGQTDGETTISTEPTGDIQSETPTEGNEELILGKFKTQDDLTNAYGELEKSYGDLKRQKSPEAPEEYKFDFSEHEVLGKQNDIVNEVMETSPLISKALEKFKEHGVSQEAASDILADVLEADFASLPSPEDELAKLGNDADNVIKEVESYVHRFPMEEQQLLQQLCSTADGLKFIQKLSKMGGSKDIPTKSQAPTKSADEYFAEAMAVKEKYGKDFQFKTEAIKEYEALMKKGIEIEG